MPRAEPGLVTEELERAVASVSQRLLGRPLERVESLPAEQEEADERLELTATCGLSGAWSGAVTIRCDQRVGEALTRWLLSDTEEPLRSSDLRDGLGELASILAGNLKGCLPAGTSVGLPTVVAGDRYRVWHPHAQLVVRLACQVAGQGFEVSCFEERRC